MIQRFISRNKLFSNKQKRTLQKWLKAALEISSYHFQLAIQEVVFMFDVPLRLVC